MSEPLPIDDLAPAPPPPNGRRWLVRAVAGLGSLKVRLILACVLVIAASVLATTGLLLERIERRSEQAVLDLESLHIEQMAAMVGQRVVTLQRMMRGAADHMPMAALADTGAAIDFLQQRLALLQSFEALYVVDRHGRVVASHDGIEGHAPVLNFSAHDWFRRSLGQGMPVVSAALRGPGGPSNQQRSVMFSMPVLGPDRQVAGLFAGAMSLDARNLLDDLSYGAQDAEGRATTVVTDARGFVVAHPVRERLLGEIGSEPLMADVVGRWVTQGRPVEPTALVARGGGHFVTLVGVPGADWVLFRAVADGQLLGGLDEAREEAAWWAAGVALAGGLLLLALLAHLLGPLTRLRERVRRLHDETTGFDQGWPEAAGEIGELSRTLKRALQDRARGEHAQRALMRQMRSVMAAAPIGIAITRHRRFELVSAEWCALMGWPADGLVGLEARRIFASDRDYDALGPEVAAAFAAGQPFAGELQFRRHDGGLFWGRLSGRPVDARDAEVGTIWLLQDVTHQRAERERLAWSARHDPLTRLLNRTAFEELLAERLAQPLSSGPAVLLVMDLDHFKRVNDNAGHAAGDAVLRTVAEVLTQQLRGSDAAARLGGDEFALLLSRAPAAGGLGVGQRLCEAVSRLGVEHGGRWLGIGASVGLAELVPGSGESPAAWLARADGACYDAKRGGRGGVRLALAVAAPSGQPAPA